MLSDVRMRVIARRTLLDFVESRRRHHDFRSLSQAVAAWFAEAKAANWASMADVKAHFRSASVVSADRVVFNIKGNDYRLVAAMDFEKAIVFIKWIGTNRD